MKTASIGDLIDVLKMLPQVEFRYLIRSTSPPVERFNFENPNFESDKLNFENLQAGV